MPIVGRLYTLLTICFVLGFHKTLLLSVLVGLILMDISTCLEHLSQDYDLKSGFLVSESFIGVSVIFCLFLLFALGLKSLFSPGLFQFLRDLRGKSSKSKIVFYPENPLDGNFDVGQLKDVTLNNVVEEITEYPNSFPLSSHINHLTEEDDDELQAAEGDSETNVLALRKLIKMERRRANAATAELVKERAASASAAEEAMAMILRLQNEKSSIEMESKQYRRLAEEKQIHDQQVIESLEWLVWRNEAEVSSLQEELKLCTLKLNRRVKLFFEN